ncbi:Uncharacterised protein [Escherichia coli]|nr:Uncharacterised protein [Escherichia coli]
MSVILLLNGYGLTNEEYAEMLAAIPYTSDDRERARQMFEYRQRRVVEGISKDAFVGELQIQLKKQGKNSRGITGKTFKVR